MATFSVLHVKYKSVVEILKKTTISLSLSLSLSSDIVKMRGAYLSDYFILF